MALPRNPDDLSTHLLILSDWYVHGKHPRILVRRSHAMVNSHEYCAILTNISIRYKCNTVLKAATVRQPDTAMAATVATVPKQQIFF